MDLDVDMANLEINEKKRIANGKFKFNLHGDQPVTSSPELDEHAKHVQRSSRKKMRPIKIEKRRVLTKPRKFLNISSSNEITNYYLDLRSEKRRVMMKPRKLFISTTNELYYLDRRVERLPPSLETIFEEPKDDNIISSMNCRQCIQFIKELSLKKDKSKVKKLAMKAQKMCLIRRLNKQVAMNLLQNNLSTIENDDCAISEDEDAK